MMHSVIFRSKCSVDNIHVPEDHNPVFKVKTYDLFISEISM